MSNSDTDRIESHAVDVTNIEVPLDLGARSLLICKGITEDEARRLTDLLEEWWKSGTKYLVVPIRYDVEVTFVANREG